MIRDEAEQLSITWLPNGKIATVTKDGVWQLRFAYDATGTRVRKSKYTGATYTTHEKTTWYVHEAGGKQLATYEMLGTNTNATLTEVPLLGTARLGMDQPDVVRTDNAVTESNITYRITGKKLYETTDHLGNVRTVIGDVKIPDGSTFAVDLKSYSNYYPFGMQQQRRCYQSAEYRYGYNGKEKDDEVKSSGNSYDYGARIYDSRLGRWMSVDPFKNKNPELSTYNMCGNNPIIFEDLDGNDFQITSLIKKEGKIYITITCTAVIVNQTTTPIDSKTLKNDISNSVNEGFSKSFKPYTDKQITQLSEALGMNVSKSDVISLKVNVKFREINTVKDIKPGDTKINIVNSIKENLSNRAAAEFLGDDVYFRLGELPLTSDPNIIIHEFGHLFGLPHLGGLLASDLGLTEDLPPSWRNKGDNSWNALLPSTEIANNQENKQATDITTSQLTRSIFNVAKNKDSQEKNTLSLEQMLLDEGD